MPVLGIIIPCHCEAYRSHVTTSVVPGQNEATSFDLQLHIRESITTIVRVDSGPAPNGASRNDERREPSQYASFASASWLVCTKSRLASILPSRAASAFRSGTDRHDKISCSRRNRRGINSS